MTEIVSKKCFEENINRTARIEQCKCNERPPGQGGSDCIGKWKDEKDKAKRVLDEAIATVQAESDALKYALEWEGKLKSYSNSIYKSAEVADKLARQIKGFKAQVGLVCINAECTTQALEQLFCQVKEIFEPCARELTTVMDRLIECLRCITDPALVRDEGILKVLQEFDLKLRELAAMQLDCLKLIIEALKCANVLFYAICPATGDKTAEEEYFCDSLSDELKALCEMLGVHIKDDEDNADCDGVSEIEALGCSMLSDDCKSGSAALLQLVPVPKFPLTEDPYYTNTECQYQKAQEDKNAKKENLDKAKKEKESAQACYDSLVKAIETAEKTKVGK